MALTPNIVRYGQASLGIEAALGLNPILITATHAGGTSYPSAHSETAAFDVDVVKANTNSAGQWAVAIVEDGVDVGGNYTQSPSSDTLLTPGVLAFHRFGNSNNPPLTINFNVPVGGTFRMVVVTGDTPANCRRADSVDTGGLSSEWHYDSDGNSVTGGVASASVTEGTDVTGAVGRKLESTAITPTAGNWHYPQSNQIAISLRPAGNPSSAITNPKQLKVALSTDAAGATRPDGIYRITPNTTGDATATGIRVDTDFNQTVGGVDHYVQIGVNNTLGDASTPAAEQADIYNIPGATVEGVTTSQRSPYVFASTGHASGITFEDTSRVRTTQPDVTISSGIQVFEDAGKAVSGVAPFKTNAYTTRQDLFKRRGPSVLTNAVPYLETYVFDAFGNPLTSTPITARSVRLSNSSIENSQNLTTDANGRIRWNYTLSATNPAFNRYIKTGSSRQSGSHVGAGPDTETGWSYFYTNINSSDPATYNLPVAGYPRRIEIEGRVFGSKEPSTNDPNVFGVNSEGLVESIWTGTLTAADIDNNGVPTGAGTAGQQLGAGSLKAKSTSKVDLATLRVIDVNRHNIRDAAGRIIDVTTDEWYRASGVFNDTLDVIHQAVASGNDSQTQLENSLGYNSNPNSLDTIAPPTDPASLKYFLSLADTTAQRNSFDMTVSGNDPVVGFTSDSGNFVYEQQVVSFEALDSSIAAIITSETLQSDPTLVRRFTYKAFRVAADVAINPSTGFNGVATDGPPTYAIWVQPDGGGAIEVLETGAMTSIGPEPSSDWYFDLVIPLGYKMIKVFAVARVNGSPIIGGEKLPLQIGYEFDAIGAFVGFDYK